MQHIDPYSDDFFKKAAQNYPLKTNAAEWENVAKKLSEFQAQHEVINGAHYKNFKRRSVLVGALLLIPFAIAVTKYFNEYNSSMNAATANKEIKLPVTNSPKFLNDANINKQNYSAATDNIERPFIDKNSIEEIERSLIQSSNKIEQQNSLNNLITIKSFKDNSVDLFQKESNKIPAAENSNSLKKSEEKNLVSTENKNKGFYIGGAIAPELTSVKLQPARKSFDIGLLVGYNLNKKLSIELGCMLAQKYYYTSGKYIVPNTIGPQDSKILAVNAFNSITEMPLTVQYNFSNDNNSRWFASAGAVSYIVHKENYSYVYTKDGEEKQGKTLHNKASQNWFSNVQMSVGYERSFNKICNIRIEPYCRIPLKGIGISDVPVTSAGVNLALIKTIK